MMKLLNSLTLLTLLITLTSCLDELPELGNENYCPGSRLEDGTCPSAKSKSLGWDFSNASNYSFNSNYVEVSSGQASLKAIDTNFSGSDFSSGSHVGTSYKNLKLSATKTVNSSLSEELTPQYSTIVSYWDLDSDGSDQSINSNNLSFTSDLLFSSSAHIGDGSLLLNGEVNERATLAYTDTLDISKGTVCLWINTSLLWGTDGGSFGSSGQGDAVLFTRMTDSVDRNGYLVLLQKSGGIRFFTADGSNFKSATIVASGTITRDRWHHVCAVYRQEAGEYNEIYVDGSSVASSVNTDQWSFATSPALYIGDSTNNYWEEYAGYMDDFVIFGTDLTPTEISSLYTNQKTRYTTELSPDWTPHWQDIVGYWKMDGNWQDSSNFNNHGNPDSNVDFSSDSKVGSKTGDFTADNSQVELDLISDDLNLLKGTYCFWIYNETTNFPSGDRYIFRTNFDSGDDLLFRFQNNDIFNAVMIASGEWKNVSGSISEVFPNNKWIHVALTWDLQDENLMELFINGIKFGDVNITNNFAGSVSFLHLGQGWSTSNFDGKIDDFSAFSVDLDDNEILLIYNRQKQKYAASYQSPVIDLGDTQNINQLSKTTNLPFMKELTTSIESSSDYTSLSGDLSNGLVGYWTLNEATSGSGPSGSDFEDLSINSNHGDESEGAALGRDGVFGHSLGFDGANDYVNIGQSDNFIIGDSSFTFSAWFKTNTLYNNGANLGGRFLTLQKSAGSTKTALGISGDGTNNIMFCGVACSDKVMITGITVDDGNWHHAVGVYDSLTDKMTLYFDGGHKVSKNVGTINPASSHIATIGAGPGAAQFFKGYIDDVAIWNRTLSEAEVKQLYRRGANRVKYQVRTCSDSTCSTDPEWETKKKKVNM